MKHVAVPENCAGIFLLIIVLKIAHNILNKLPTKMLDSFIKIYHIQRFAE